MLLSLGLFGAGLTLLVWGGNWFVDGAVGAAKRFHWPEALVGATVVSIGTTLPEVMVSVHAAVQGHGELGYGNAVGSVLCNAALIAGLSAAIHPEAAEREEARLPALFFFLAAGVYCFAAYGQGYFGQGTGLLLLGLFGLYLILTLRRLRGQAQTAETGGGSFRRELGLLVLGAALASVLPMLLQLPAVTTATSLSLNASSCDDGNVFYRWH